jgi:hypothetical protein
MEARSTANRISVRKPEGKNHLEYQNVDGLIILNNPREMS